MPFARVQPNSHELHFFDTLSIDTNRGYDRPPIIMIHGLGSSQNYYMPVIPQLPNYRCIAFDSYGAGRSKSNGEKLSLASMGEDAVGLMDEFGIEKAVLVGHSMGGPMFFTIAAAHPDRVAAVVAIGPASPKHLDPETFKKRIEMVMREGMEPLADTIPAAATNKNSTPLQKAFMRELLMNQEPKSYVSHCQVIIDAKEPNLASIKMPVLIIAGEEDMSAPLEGCECLLDNMGSARKELKFLEGVGHWHCIEAPDRVAAEIDAFCGAL